MKKIFVIILMVCSLSLLVANPLSMIYRNGDPILDRLKQISTEAGILPQSSAGPLTGHDILRQIEKLEDATLDDKSLLELESMKEKVTTTHSEMPIGAQISLSPEIYTNRDSSANEWDWAQRYNDRNPFLYAQADTIFSEHIYGIISYALAKRLNDEDFTGNSTNFPYMTSTAETQLQNSMPHTAFMGISGYRWAFITGRDTVGWGGGNTGNLTIGNHVAYHDFIHASTSNNFLRYTFLAMPMNSLDASGQAIIPNDDGPYWNTLFHGSLSRLYLAHRLEAEVRPWLRISMTEGTLFYTDRLDLRMFNPFQVLHNLQNFGEVNNSITLEIEAALARRWLLNAQFFLDQFQTPGEVDAYAENIPPNAYAGLLGLNYIKNVSKGTFQAYLEGVYTAPYVYLRAGDNTQNYGTVEYTEYNLDFVHAISMRYGRGSVSFLGYRYGPDTIVASTGLSFAHMNGFGAFGELSFFIQGKHGLRIEGDKDQHVETGLSELNRPTPTGTPTYSAILGLGGYLQIPDTQVRLQARVDIINRWHAHQHATDTQLMIGADYSLKLF